jgi:hypothetical protein
MCAFLLLSVLLYQYVRRMKRESPRAQLYHALEEFREVIDGDLDQREYERVMAWLRSARRSDSANLARLAVVMEEYLRDPETSVVPVKPTVWSRVFARAERLGRQIDPQVHRAAILVVLAILSVIAAAQAGELVWAAFQPGSFRQSFEAMLAAQANLQAITDVGWRLLRVGLESAVGLIALAAFVYMALRRDDLGTRLGVFALILSLSTVNLLNFYLDQFSAVITALLQLGALLLILSYRHWRLRPR